MFCTVNYYLFDRFKLIIVNAIALLPIKFLFSPSHEDICH